MAIPPLPTQQLLDQLNAELFASQTAARLAALQLRGAEEYVKTLEDRVAELEALLPQLADVESEEAAA